MQSEHANLKAETVGRSRISIRDVLRKRTGQVYNRKIKPEVDVRLSKQTSDAVKILVYCTRTQDDLVKVAEIAERTGVTKALGLKLVNLLSRLKYLETVRGPKGGIRLSCDPETTRLGDVVRDFETFGMATNAAPVDKDSVVLPPALEGCVDDAFEAFVAVLNQNTLADLASAKPSLSIAADGEEKPRAKTTRRRARGDKTARATASPRGTV